MTLLLLLLSLAAAQAWVVIAPALGGWAPDPGVCLAAFAGLYWPRRTLPLAALAVGWGRALVLLEPAGGQILCAWLAMAVVASQRGERAGPWTRFVIAAFAAACAWVGAAWGLGHVLDAAPTAGRELFAGVLVAVPIARAARGTARLTGWVSA